MIHSASNELGVSTNANPLKEMLPRAQPLVGHLSPEAGTFAAPILSVFLFPRPMVKLLLKDLKPVDT